MNMDSLNERPAIDGLMMERAYIGGTWIEAASGNRFVVRDPATGHPVTAVPDLSAGEALRAVDAAEQALPGWRRLTAKQRATVLRAWYDLIVANADSLAALMVMEQGKPFAEARGEVLFGAAYVEWYAEEAKRLYGDIVPTYADDRRVLLVKQPIGVVFAVTPWNFPSAMVTRKVAPALAAGCTVVLKPAEQTPLSALALARLAEQAGLPPGVLNGVTTADPVASGEALTASAKVAKVTFTGSTEVGKLLMRQCAATVKKVTLELGGHAPFVVFDDADLAAAVDGAMASKFRTSGQTCVCANRIIVQSTIHDRFVEAFTDAVSRLEVGQGFAPGVTQGPLIDERAVDKVERHVADARAAGAEVVLGGRRHALGGTFFEPTVLTGVSEGMLVAREETFGPVAPILAFETEAQAIAMANNTRYGLAAYAYTRDLGRAFRLGEAIEAGSVGINTGSMSSEVAPAGGMKESGIGREGSRYGIDDFVELKQLCIAGLVG